MKEAGDKVALVIKNWSKQDQPREKLALKGRNSLSDAELLAILIGSGSRNVSAVDLSKMILASVDGNLQELGKKEIKQLMTFKGIGEAKAVTIAAALELGRRRQASEAHQKTKISCSDDAYKIIAPLIEDLKVEQFWIMLLNQNNKVISKRKISSGGVTATVVDPKVIFKHALEALATGIILIHNHPSGNLQPSKADLVLTEKLYAAGKSLDINITDHLIISENGYYSFADNKNIFR